MGPTVHKAFAVARREFVERVRTRWFLISTLLVPVLMAASILVPVLATNETEVPMRLLVVDRTTTGLGDDVAVGLNSTGSFFAQPVAVEELGVGGEGSALTDLVELNLWDGVVDISTDAVNESSVGVLVDRVLTGSQERLIEDAVGRAVVARRLSGAGVGAEVVALVTERVVLEQTLVGDEAAEEEELLGALVLGYLMWLVLYMAILLYGLSVMTSVVEEKTSHIVEVLVASLRPVELLAGKIVGVGAIGLFQMLLWALFLSGFAAFASLNGWVAATPGLVLPDTTFADGAVFVGYFVLGYLLYAALFAATGATIGSESEARQAQFPVVMLLVIPTILLAPALTEPDGPLAVALSYIPFSAPVIMPVLWITGAASGAAVLTSGAVLLLSSIAVTLLAAKIYRIGILTSGSRPGWRELLRWIKTA